MSDRDRILQRLKDVHSFPGDYVFKVIGTNSPEFLTRVIQAAVNVLGSDADPRVSTRESSGEKHLSITLTVTVTDPESVLNVYEIMQDLEGVKFLL